MGGCRRTRFPLLTLHYRFHLGTVLSPASPVGIQCNGKGTPHSTSVSITRSGISDPGAFMFRRLSSGKWGRNKTWPSEVQVVHILIMISFFPWSSRLNSILVRSGFLNCWIHSHVFGIRGLFHHPAPTIHLMILILVFLLNSLYFFSYFLILYNTEQSELKIIEINRIFKYKRIKLERSRKAYLSIYWIYFFPKAGRNIFKNIVLTYLICKQKFDISKL